jgi:hypothetical protein
VRSGRRCGTLRYNLLVGVVAYALCMAENVASADMQQNISSLLALHVMNNCPVIAGGGWDLFEPLRTRDFLYNISIVSAEDPAAAYILSVQRI